MPSPSVRSGFAKPTTGHLVLCARRAGDRGDERRRFGRLAAAAPDARVLWVRIGNAVNRVLLARFERAWPEILARLEEGAQVLELR